MPSLCVILSLKYQISTENIDDSVDFWVIFGLVDFISATIDNRFFDDNFQFFKHWWIRNNETGVRENKESKE